MPPVMTDPVDRRLRRARPESADVPLDAAETPGARELLSRVRAAQPAPARHRRMALPSAAAAVAVTAAIVAVTGIPGSSGSRQDALARPLALAVHWFDPSAGTVLHARSTLTSRTPDAKAAALTQEIWQSVDDPALARIASVQEGVRAESAQDGIYDPATDTVYEAVPPGPRQIAAIKRSIERKIDAARAAGASDEQIAEIRKAGREAIHPPAGPDRGAAAPITGDPTVAKIRSVLEHHQARVAGQRSYRGVEAYAIELDPFGDAPPGDTGARVRWTLLIATGDGRPLELRSDNGPGTAAIETTRWQTYELLRGSDSEQLVSVRGAHPGARVVRDPDAFETAMQRLYRNG
jgi:hypothetical protein